MTPTQIVGAIILALPFVGLFVAIVLEKGMGAALGIFAITAAVVATISLGAYLLGGAL